MPARTVYVVPRPAEERGFECCCGLCRICTCKKTGFFFSFPGILKSLETVIGFICQFLLLNYGVKYAENLGISYYLSLTTSSSGFLTSLVLLFCYLVSDQSRMRIKSSLLEIAFNGLMCTLYLTAASLLAKDVHQHLFYYYHTIPNFSAYPALTAVYVMGFIIGIVHGIDTFLAVKDYRSYS